MPTVDVQRDTLPLWVGKSDKEAGSRSHLKRSRILVALRNCLCRGQGGGLGRAREAIEWNSESSQPGCAQAPLVFRQALGSLCGFPRSPGERGWRQEMPSQGVESAAGTGAGVRGGWAPCRMFRSVLPSWAGC